MHKSNVFITVDTEHSIGGAFKSPLLKPVGNEKLIYGKKNGKEYGIPLMMDIADNYGLRLTFFLEVFNKYYFGTGETFEVAEYIKKRNHDVQLHIHPNYQYFNDNPLGNKFSDLMGQYDLEQQTIMLNDGLDTIKRYGIAPITAFRAGCFGANDETIKALALTGFLIDSSYNKAYLNYPCLFLDKGINDLTEENGLFLFPVTNFKEATGFLKERFRPLDISGVSFEEIRHILNLAKSGTGPRNYTIILHSFSFIKNYDLQYTNLRVRNNTIQRFEKLCSYLAENAADFNVCTFGELSHTQLNKMVKNNNHQIPQVPPYLSLFRYCVQVSENLI